MIFYYVEFPYVATKQYSTNIIANNILNQINLICNYYIILEDIVNYK